MDIAHLLKVLPEWRGSHVPQLSITNITQDTRRVEKGSLFVAVRGSKSDGHEFITEAIRKGAECLVVEDSAFVPQDYKGVIVEVKDSRKALDILASQFYDNPSKKLFCIGVTGTNGKTSTTYMIEHILTQLDVPTGVIGTVNHHLGDQVWPSEMTTPDPILLQERLSQFKESGAKALAIEVSSHALSQKRVDSIVFNTVVFTNLTRDHLDYHENMQEYFEAKQRLFTDLMRKTSKTPCFAIVNIDDDYGKILKVSDPAVILTYGLKNADFSFKIQNMDFSQTTCGLQTPVGNYSFTIPLSGVHNVYNAVAAIVACVTAGFHVKDCFKALENFEGVPGRLQKVINKKDIHVFIDYAHSPDALENVLKSLNKIRTENNIKSKILTLFGCGGDRDKGKRPLMAQVAVKYSDFIQITSDNPRTENPRDIIQDILNGIKNVDSNKYSVEEDRKKSIEAILNKAESGDVVLIAGKGHEDYQIIGTTKYPFSDLEVAKNILEGKL